MVGSRSSALINRSLCRFDHWWTSCWGPRAPDVPWVDPSSRISGRWRSICDSGHWVGGAGFVSELLNLVGLSAGVVLYAMLLAMVVRAGRRPVVPSRFDPLLLVTAVLGLVWNLCALLAYELPKSRHRGTVSPSPDTRLQRARLPSRGGRALGPARRARRGAQRVEAVDCGRGLCRQRDCRLASPLVRVGRLARSLRASACVC